MPIYEYRCQACQHELEKLQKMTDDPLIDCPACGRPALTKLVSAAGFRLKGGGWYETDFKKDNKRNLVGEGKGEKRPDTRTDTGGDKQPDKKPAASSEKSGGASSASTGQAA